MKHIILICAALVMVFTIVSCSDNSITNWPIIEDNINVDSLLWEHCILKQKFGSHQKVLACYNDWFEMYRDSIKPNWPVPPHCPGRPVNVTNCEGRQ